MPNLAKRILSLLIVAVLTQAISQAGDTITYRDLVSRLTDLERLARPIVVGEKTFASTSHDRGSKYNEKTDRYENWSANRDGGGSIRREGDAQVMVDLNKHLAWQDCRHRTRRRRGNPCSQGHPARIA
jgi:hypothetical protein